MKGEIMIKNWDITTIKEYDFCAFFDELNIRWHQKPGERARLPQTFEDMFWNVHFFNFSLWHEEDQARRTDVSDHIIAQNKRNIDKYNQRRNDSIESLDSYILTQLRISSKYREGFPLNSETPGSIIDRLSIISLKVYHMEEQTRREDATEEHRLTCKKKHQTLLEQRTDLSNCFSLLIIDYISGKKSMKVYFQFKMYNDQNLNPALYEKQR